MIHNQSDYRSIYLPVELHVGNLYSRMYKFPTCTPKSKLHRSTQKTQNDIICGINSFVIYNLINRTSTRHCPYKPLNHKPHHSRAMAKKVRCRSLLKNRSLFSPDTTDPYSNTLVLARSSPTPKILLLPT